MGEYNVIVKDKNGTTLTKEQLKEKEIDSEPYYINMALITKRIKNEFNFDNG